MRATRAPRWYGIPARVLLVTFIGTLLAFAVSLLLAILGAVIVSSLRGVHADMTVAYRRIALPASIASGCVIMIFVLVLEIRRYRQVKALSAIEKMG